MFFLARTLWGLSPLIVYAWERREQFTPLLEHELEEYLYEGLVDLNFLVAYRQHLVSRGMEVPKVLDEYLLVHCQRKTEGGE